MKIIDHLIWLSVVHPKTSARLMYFAAAVAIPTAAVTLVIALLFFALLPAPLAIAAVIGATFGNALVGAGLGAIHLWKTGI